MKTIAVTGGIATGKSTFSKVVQSLGYPVIDCDALVHESYKKGGEIYTAVLGHFGEIVLGASEEIDRSKVAEIVFNNEVALEALNQLTHPIVMKMVSKQISAYEAEGFELVFVDVPLLFEAKLQGFYEASVLIDTSDLLQLSRLMARNGFSQEEAKLRIANQMPLSEKRKLATYKVCNDSDFETFESRIKALLDSLT